MKFWVTMAIDGRFICEVDAEDFEKAKEKANAMYCDADFGELECIDAKVVNAEDEKGNFVDFD